ncbi:cupin domain-containing protein [Empedobacter brevis]|uniref:cupin domain-containing protein n=1 Tax=Empedobacter brevis TaxID=247 RepID=UPI0039B0A806
MEINKVNLQSQLDTIKDFWNLKEIAKVNNHSVKIFKLNGDLEMHKHDNGDKLLLIIDGTMYVEFLDRTEEVKTGEFIVIPSGVEHKPFTKEEASAIMFELL